MSYKINSNFNSPSEAFAKNGLGLFNFRIPFTQRVFAGIENLRYKNERKHNVYLDGFPTRAKQDGLWSGPILGGLQPWLDVYKEAVDTFKPYKSDAHISRDMMILFRALGNLLEGAFNVVITPVHFILSISCIAATVLGTISDGIGITNGRRGLSTLTRLPEVFVNLVRTDIGWLVDGVSRMALGVVQTAETVLMPCRLMLRTGITSYKGRPALEDDAGFKRVTKQLQEVSQKIASKSTKDTGTKLGIRVINNNLSETRDSQQYQALLFSLNKKVKKAGLQRRKINTLALKEIAENPKQSLLANVGLSEHDIFYVKQSVLGNSSYWGAMGRDNVQKCQEKINNIVPSPAA